MGEYSDLPGVKGGSLPAFFFRSVSGAMIALRRNRACDSVGDHGSIIVFTDDAGAYRCLFFRYWSTIDEQTFRTKVQVKQWLKEWLPRQHKQY